MNKQTKRLIIITGIIMLLITLYIATVLIGRIGKEKIIINYAPSFARLTINGKESSSYTHYLKPGIYEIELKYDNFFTETATLDTSKNKEINIILLPANQTGESIVKNNPLYISEVEEIVSKTNSSESQKQKDIYPFRDMLPIEMGVRYKIGYGEKSEANKNQNPYTMALYINSDSAFSRYLALKDVSTKLQINPADIEIIFKDFNNPFKDENGTN